MSDTKKALIIMGVILTISMCFVLYKYILVAYITSKGVVISNQIVADQNKSGVGTTARIIASQNISNDHEISQEQIREIENRTRTIAEEIATFYSDREKDIRIAGILPRDEKAYESFLNSKTLGVIKASNVGIVKTPTPIYREIAFIDKNGKEILKITKDGNVPVEHLRNMSDPANGEFGNEDYFLKAKILQPGQIYIGPVIGYHITKDDFIAGKRFNGIQRIAAPVFDSKGFAGVIELALNFVHLSEHVDHIVPTEADKILAVVNADDNNYAFMVDRNGFIVSHPNDTLIMGLGPDKQPVKVLQADNYKQLTGNGSEAMNVASMGFKDDTMPKIHKLASEGKSGSINYAIGNSRFFVTYANIPYYGNGFSRPMGPGWIGMMVRY